MASLSSAALLVVDIQNDFVHPAGKVGEATGDMSPLLSAVDSINRLIATARQVKVPIVYIQVTHSPELDAPSYRARYTRRGMTPEDLLCADDSWGAEFYDGLTPPEPGDLALTKHGYGAFTSGELGDYLRDNSLDTVIVTGVVTELCVLATVSGGFEAGFHVLVPRETTASVDIDAANAALSLIDKFYGTIANVDELLVDLQKSSSKRLET